jgi:hypothetical protein
MICKICNKELKSLGGLHNHLSKTHNFSQEDYYHRYAPRYDKFDNQLIIYKSYHQYLDTDFNSRGNFAKWIKANKSEGKSYVLKKLKERLERKKIDFVPNQVIGKSLYLPSMTDWEFIYGNLDVAEKDFNKDGIKFRYNYNIPIFDFERCNDLKVYIDTREQKPLLFDIPNQSMKLSVGDYTAAEPYFSGVFIERKNLSDACGTLTAGRERFEREILRAKELGFYLVILIEAPFEELMYYSAKTRFNQKLTGGHLTHAIREISETYGEVCQFVFSGCRKRSSRLVERILIMKDRVRELDLEYLKDHNII